jgi:hypothetical protein
MPARLGHESSLAHCSKYLLSEYDDQIEQNDQKKAGCDNDADPKTGGQGPIIAD